jgi:predicted RNA-binding Zn-ribbon protein involved in translation (DUF1610 family)
MPPRPSYDTVDEADREAQLSSRTNVLSKSFVTDLWMKVITRAIDDIALYTVMRIRDKPLKEEDLENEESARGFLFDDGYRIPMGDYLVDILCPKCEEIWTKSMSTVVSQHSVCPHCGHKTNKKYIDYSITENQVLKDISLKDLIELWGVEDIEQFRQGVRRRVKEIVEKKLKIYAKKK